MNHTRWRRRPPWACRGSGGAPAPRRRFVPGGHRPLLFEQPPGRLLEGGVVGDLRQAQGVAHLGPVAEDRLQAAIVGLEELAEGQRGEELVLGVVVPGELRGVRQQRDLGSGQSGAGQLQGRFGHRTSGLHTYTTSPTPKRFSTEQGRHRARRAAGGLIRSCSTPFGITEVGTPAASSSFQARWTCSTPFGIIEVGTGGAAGRRAGVDQCSTPFGITEVGTAPAGANSGGPQKCSTPFGITEVGTAGRLGTPGGRRECSILLCRLEGW